MEKKYIFVIPILFFLITSNIQIIFSQPDAEYPHSDEFEMDCELCHSDESWQVDPQNIEFNHEQHTGFTLDGKHNTIACITCHTDLKFEKNDRHCFNCHTDIHKGELGTDCDNCHTPDNWINYTKMRHLHKDFSFPLVGVHSQLDCEACHYNEQRTQYKTTPLECFGCHLNDYNSTTNPDHKLAGFSLDCQSCHMIEKMDWHDAEFEHSPEFPLTGVHDQECADCHTSAFASTSNECYTCHQSDYLETQNPDHSSFGFPTLCETCHTTSGWQGTQFEHIEISGFELVGIHNTLQCMECHQDNQLNGLPSDCYGCHQLDYSSVSDPNHVQNNFNHDCTECHSVNNWELFNFDHTLTNFILDGAHKNLSCEDCHAEGYASVKSDCWSCHQSDFEAVPDPNHVTNNFSHDCLDCHNTNAFIPVSFDHAGTLFPLEGAHTTVNCIDCHSTGYTNMPTECWSCHQSDFEAVPDPNHVTNNFSHDCLDCHNTNAFIPASFDHAGTLFPLEGAHTTVNCIDCHSTGYTNMPTECWSCHQSDFEAVPDPNHVTNNFSHDCLDCHNTNAFIPASFDHAGTLFPLEGAHTTVNCIDCHSTGYTNMPTECWSCHQSDFEAVPDPNHVTNNFSHDCLDCHNTNAFIPASFDHAGTLFPLEGAHTTVNCIDCHSTGYTNMPTECWSCHQSDFEAVPDPNHVTNNFSHDCLDCHNTNAFIPASFDHAGTLFPLEGAHTTVNCIDCHSTGYTNMPTECWSCHQSDFEAVPDPNHVTNNFSHDCLDCHNTNAFIPASFDHAGTLFPLEGAHTTVNCIDCHSTGYTNMPTECWSCHQSDFEAVPDPNHVTNNFSHDCLDCHNTNAFIPASFDHAGTLFPLEGAHTTVNCIDCHSTGYTNMPTECWSCHQSDFEAVPDPNHVTNNFSHDCLDCHNTNAFIPASFDHAGTLFPLEGAHTTVNCIDCHSTGYTNMPTECWSCHQSDFEAVPDPNHVTNNFSHDCLDCHNTNAFIPASFDHAGTLFPLEGAHTTVNCIDCHSTGYTNMPTECWSCHQSDFEAVPDPNHVTNNFSHDCLDCHNTNAFIPASFDHAGTLFPLEGAHTTVNCIDCHSTGYTNMPTECWSCHQSDFEAVPDPNHVTNNFSHDCLDCHNTNAFIPASFDHAGTLFPLEGAHTTVNCIDCHSTGYTNMPTECWSCHQSDFEAVTDPNHVTNNFSHDCTECHSINGWLPASFDHLSTSFQLTGAHLTVECSSCHINGYDNTPTNCYDCHSDDYIGSNNPNHNAAHFPTTCNSCHNTTAWRPANWDHDRQYFPIYSGEHAGEWNTCNNCHVATNDYSQFECINCHEHNKKKMDDKHDGEDGYVYSSSACYACHPRGYAEDD